MLCLVICIILMIGIRIFNTNVDQKTNGQGWKGKLRVEVWGGDQALINALCPGVGKHGDRAMRDADHRVLIQQDWTEELALMARGAPDPSP